MNSVATTPLKSYATFGVYEGIQKANGDTFYQLSTIDEAKLLRTAIFDLAVEGHVEGGTKDDNKYLPGMGANLQRHENYPEQGKHAVAIGTDEHLCGDEALMKAAIPLLQERGYQMEEGKEFKKLDVSA